MKDILKYKDFLATVHFSTEDEVFYGEIVGIDDLILFEGRTVDELKQSFHESVNDYILLCKELGKKPEKSYKGSLNIRLPLSIHQKATRLAAIRGISLNQLINEAVEKEVQTGTGKQKNTRNR